MLTAQNRRKLISSVAVWGFWHEKEHNGSHILLVSNVTVFSMWWWHSGEIVWDLWCWKFRVALSYTQRDHCPHGSEHFSGLVSQLAANGTFPLYTHSLFVSMGSSRNLVGFNESHHLIIAYPVPPPHKARIKRVKPF